MLMWQVSQEDAKALDERWSREMDEVLREGVLRYGAAWDLVAGHMAPRACSQEEVEKRYFPQLLHAQRCDTQRCYFFLYNIILVSRPSNRLQ